MNRNQILIIVITILFILLITIGLSYAYFTANLTGIEESTTITVTGGSLTITYDGGEEININNIIPSDNPAVIKNFTVTGNNTTDIEMGYQISLVIEENTFTSDALKYKLIGTNTDNNGDVAPSINELTNIGTGEQIIDLGVGYFDNPTSGNKVHTYILEIYFLNQDYNQNEDMGKEIKAHILIESSEILFNYIKGVNKPVLFTGMTPIKWSGISEVVTTENDPEWYDYNEKRWANAKTQDGSYWVWIPRYAYKITSGYHSSETGTIDVQFLKGKSNKTADNTLIEIDGYEAHIKDTSMYHFLHPAFQFGGDYGFWAAKYEATAAEGVHTVSGSCISSPDNAKTKTVKVIPNATSWRCVSIGNAFDAIRNMKNKTIYGWAENQVDPHLMTNLEWGAITYLSKSVYGANNEIIWNNAYNLFRTGCSGSKYNAENESTCYGYNSVNGQKASTTHNIYGIYDMRGGAFEQTSGYVNNNHTYLTEYGLSIINSTQFKNIYQPGIGDIKENNYEANKNIYGDAVYETSSSGNGKFSWDEQISYMVFDYSPWFVRGGRYLHYQDTGLYSYYSTIGSASVSNTFRPTLFPLIH